MTRTVHIGPKSAAEMDAFARELDAIRDETRRNVGERDARYIRHVLRLVRILDKRKALHPALSARLPRLRNATVRVKEWHGEVIFLHEVTEGVALHDLDNTRRFIDRVRSTGAKVALDDFGDDWHWVILHDAEPRGERRYYTTLVDTICGIHLDEGGVAVTLVDTGAPDQPTCPQCLGTDVGPGLRAAIASADLRIELTGTFSLRVATVAPAPATVTVQGRIDQLAGTVTGECPELRATFAGTRAASGSTASATACLPLVTARLAPAVRSVSMKASARDSRSATVIDGRMTDATTAVGSTL